MAHLVYNTGMTSDIKVKETQPYYKISVKPFLVIIVDIGVKVGVKD